MTIRKRLMAVARQIGLGKRIVVTIFLNNRDQSRARERAEAAVQRGARIRTIRFSVGERAETREEAVAIVEASRASRGDHCGIVVHSSANPSEVLASWTPKPPDWLQALKARRVN